MKRIFGIILSLSALAAFGDLTGGNSSGGDEPYGAGSLPYEAKRATIIGVVDAVVPGTTWQVTFGNIFLGNGGTVSVVAPRNQAQTITVRSLLFLRGNAQPHGIGRVVPSSAARLTALVEYLANATPRARLNWAQTYATHPDSYLSWSAGFELEYQSKGTLKAEVLSFVVRTPGLKSLHLTPHLVASYLPHADAEAYLKDMARDSTELEWQRDNAARSLMFNRRYRALVELWKDGKDGADAWLQARAQSAWNTLYGNHP